jgi:hypothetical protein
MIVQCSVEEVTKVIDYARSGKLVYLKVEKKDDFLIMNYSLIDEVHNESDIERIKNVQKTSIKTTFDLINKLTQLNDIIVKDIKPQSYTLTYECKANANAPIYSHSSILPNGVFDVQTRQAINVDWDNVFTGKLEEIVPGLYSKRSSKKYVPVTYKELIEILRN